MIDTLEKLGMSECDTCGETRECFDSGAGAPVCGPCYADALGHGAQFGCIEACADGFEAAIGREITEYERSMIARYYNGCDRDCCHC